jgi:hypothetical protein
MWHLSEEYITGKFKVFEDRFDILESRLADQTRELKACTDERIEQLESDTHTKIKDLEERINERLDTILGLLDRRREPELLEDESETSVSSPKGPAGKDVLNAPAVGIQPDVGRRHAHARN